MDGKREVLSAEALALAIETVRRIFTRENLGGMEALAAQTLVLLAAEPGLSLKECAERLSAGQSNVSTAVKTLEESELITRIRPKSDPRTHVLKPSSKGKARVRELLAAVVS